MVCSLRFIYLNRALIPFAGCISSQLSCLGNFLCLAIFRENETWGGTGPSTIALKSFIKLFSTGNAVKGYIKIIPLPIRLAFGEVLVKKSGDLNDDGQLSIARTVASTRGPMELEIILYRERKSPLLPFKKGRNEVFPC